MDIKSLGGIIGQGIANIGRNLSDAARNIYESVRGQRPPTTAQASADLVRSRSASMDSEASNRLNTNVELAQKFFTSNSWPEKKVFMDKLYENKAVNITKDEYNWECNIYKRQHQENPNKANLNAEKFMKKILDPNIQSKLEDLNESSTVKKEQPLVQNRGLE